MMPSGMRPIDPDYDPERDPEYQDALSRYVNPDEPSNEQRAREVNAAAYGSPAPRPMGTPASALSAMAPGASMPAPPERPEDMSPEELDAAVQAKLGPKANWNPRPAPTAAGTSQFNDLQAAARAPAPPSTMFGAGLQGLRQVAPYIGNAVMRMSGMNTGPILPDSTPEAPPLPEPAAPPAPVSQLHGYLRAPPPAKDQPLSAQQGANIMATLRGPVANIVRDASGVSPVPSGDIPPGSPVGPASSVPPAALARAREVLGPAKERPDPLSLALAAARNNRLIAGSARAGAMAIGRGAGPGFDELDANADRPLQELGLREQAADKAKAEAAALGPLSPMEQTVYGKLLAQAGVNLDPATLAKLPAGKVRALIPDLEKLGALEATRGEKAAALKQAADEAEKNRQARHDDVATMHAGMGSLRGDRLQEQKDKRLETDRQKASKDAEEFSQTADARATLERALQSKPGEIAGVGRASGRLASWGVGSDAGIQNRQAMSTLGNLILKARSGSAVTPSEEERAKIETGMAPGASEQQMRIGAEATLKVMKRAEANTHAKYREDVWGEIGGSGGYVPTRGGAPAPRAAGGGPSADDLERLWGGR
jgi:hypothetical protein